MANKHTIVLMQTSQNRSTRTFMDYGSITQAMDGICGLYERKLKELNPATRNITYDIADLYNFIDGLTDLSALVFHPLITIDMPLDYPRLKEMNVADERSVYDHAIQAYLPYDRQWIKHSVSTP